MQLTREEVFTKVANIISNHFDVDADKVNDQLSIKDDLNADSISIMEFVLELEDEFGTEISDEDAENIETVGGAVEYILSHQG
ncbi:acyl carrier protein [Enterococcus phoeniculicola]|jgi:acyl carrier protein|nr:acyl carrier protein [Enterococcus phoeniculicola]